MSKNISSFTNIHFSYIQESGLQLCATMTEASRLKYTKRVGHIYLLGAPTVSGLSERKFAVLGQVMDIPDHTVFSVYQRLIVNGDMIHSVEYTRPKRTNDTVVCFFDGRIGVVSKIINFSTGGLEYCFVLLNIMQDLCATQLRHGRKTTSLAHMKMCSFTEGSTTCAIQPSAIMNKCLLIGLSNEMYVCSFPNTTERDV